MVAWDADPRIVRYLVGHDRWVEKEALRGLSGDSPGTTGFLEGMRYVARNPSCIRATQELRDLYENWRWIVTSPSLGVVHCPDDVWAHIVAEATVRLAPKERVKVLQLRAVHTMKMPDPQPKPEHQVETF